MNIYIGNLHNHASAGQIKDLFKEFGQVTAVVIMDDGGHSKGYAMVQMNDRNEGMEAIRKLHMQNFMNQYLEVSESAPDNSKGHRTRKQQNDSDSSA